MSARHPGIVSTLRSVLQFQPATLDPVERRLRKAASVADLRRIAKRRVPRGVFDYIDGAAEDERTMAANRIALDRIGFDPRVLVDVSDIDTSSTLLGRQLKLPLVLAPTGFTRIADPAGELAVARAADRAGLPYTLSTLSTRSIEEVAAVSNGAKWFQVYVWRDRGLVLDMVQRAKAAGYEALMVTVDTPVLGRRERDVRRGFSLPPKVGLGTLIDGAIHPGWTWDFVRAEPILFANVATSSAASSDGAAGDGSTAVSLSTYVNSQFDPSLQWRDLDWLRGHWDGPIIVKGIQSVADAERTVAAGAEGLVISNHGGRQLDGAPATADLIAPIADAVGGQIVVVVDGGIRRGSDVVKAVALGADACMIGRAYLYGLAAAGERGVAHVLDLFDTDVRRTMALIGVSRLADVNRSCLTGVAPR
ncbi:MAG: alpha-hydroxy acid oxidase [Acidimicrobiia bacterium]